MPYLPQLAWRCHQRCLPHTRLRSLPSISLALPSMTPAVKRRQASRRNDAITDPDPSRSLLSTTSAILSSNILLKSQKKIRSHWQRRTTCCRPSRHRAAPPRSGGPGWSVLPQSVRGCVSWMGVNSVERTEKNSFAFDVKKILCSLHNKRSTSVYSASGHSSFAYSFVCRIFPDRLCAPFTVLFVEVYFGSVCRRLPVCVAA